MQGEQCSSPKHARFRGDATDSRQEDASYREFVESGRALDSTLYGDDGDDGENRDEEEKVEEKNENDFLADLKAAVVARDTSGTSTGTTERQVYGRGKRDK